MVQPSPLLRVPAAYKLPLFEAAPKQDHPLELLDSFDVRDLPLHQFQEPVPMLLVKLYLFGLVFEGLDRFEVVQPLDVRVNLCSLEC